MVVVGSENYYLVSLHMKHCLRRTVLEMCNDHIPSVHYTGLSLSELIGSLRPCRDVQIYGIRYRCLFLVSLKWYSFIVQHMVS